MAKKKNRQKEFKRKQKLMIKVVSEEEIALTESLGYQPVFVERRKIQNFDEQNIAMMQYFYEYGVYPDVQEINSKLGTGILIGIKIMLYSEKLCILQINKREINC